MRGQGQSRSGSSIKTQFLCGSVAWSQFRAVLMCVGYFGSGKKWVCGQFGADTLWQVVYNELCVSCFVANVTRFSADRATSVIVQRRALNRQVHGLQGFV